MLFSSMVSFGVTVRFSVWFVSVSAHVGLFILLSVVVVAIPYVWEVHHMQIYFAVSGSTCQLDSTQRRQRRTCTSATH